LRLDRGQIYGVVGANGGGKTTALRILAGLLPADAGRGRVLGVDLRAHPARLRGRVGYMTQHHSLYRDLTVQENLLAWARLYGVADPWRRVARLLDEHGLERSARERVGRLSGGWVRRAQFAAALVPSPRLLVLDEPTAGLDLQAGQQLWASVAELAAAGMTVLVSTHDLSEANRCDLVGVFVEGKIVADGAVEEVIRRSAARVVRVATAGLDAASVRANLPGLAVVRWGARQCDLVFHGEVSPAALRWLQDRNLFPQAEEPTLEDAVSVFVSRHPLAA
ncbi:MAG: ABC transporter ATP-binding protein, partial [Verrucomicrobia bacterium]|nr:ABC transporter ATP-binding protein [Verrucomicrobiota bacterium]